MGMVGRERAWGARWCWAEDAEDATRVHGFAWELQRWMTAAPRWIWKTTAGGCCWVAPKGDTWLEMVLRREWGTGQWLLTGSVNPEQPCCKLNEWSNTKLLLLTSTGTVYRGPIGQWWLGALTAPLSCSPDTQVRSRSSGQGTLQAGQMPVTHFFSQHNCEESLH